MEKIAGRFAAKEAVFKVFGKDLTLSKIEILSDPFSGTPFSKINDKMVYISISHDGDYAIAVAQILNHK